MPINFELQIEAKWEKEAPEDACKCPQCGGDIYLALWRCYVTLCGQRVRTDAVVCQSCAEMGGLA